MMGRAAVRVLMRAVDTARSQAALREATRLGEGVRVFGWPLVANAGTLLVGDRVCFISRPAPVEIFVEAGGELVIGDRALLESGACLRVRGRVRLGSGARVGAGCVIDDDGPTGGIDVGDGAWLEDGVVVIAGARIPAGARLRRPSVDSEPDSASGPQPSIGARPAADALAADVGRRVRTVVGRIVAAASEVDAAAVLSHIKGWDSLAALRVLVALEKEFGVVLPHNLFSESPTLANVAPLILGGLARRSEVQ